MLHAPNACANRTTALWKTGDDARTLETALLQVIKILLEVKQQQRVHQRRVIRLLERQSERLERLEALTGAAFPPPAPNLVAPSKLPAKPLRSLKLPRKPSRTRVCPLPCIASWPAWGVATSGSWQRAS
ncbi:uncharacterized protein LOC119390872 [Rhipicephalus sanguineus]|uniref:uncharacterized protein LOC119390872 n=1 Tax=Rhipicephalus sanguineus TaxID=34632 RepID=UPI0018944ED4|nr:uncharacterized protein LOC119390872 [Rhipicephalus sanguineus]